MLFKGSVRFMDNLFLSTNIICKGLARRWKGGGRPGARPAFSWKEKAKLRLNTKRSRDVKIESFGPLSSLGELLSKAKVLDLKDEGVTDLSIQEFLRANVNRRKNLDSALLFGPAKPTGPARAAPSGPQGRRFSHRRIFGGQAGES